MPVAELTRLLRLHRGYQEMNAGDLAVEHGDLAGAGRAYAAAEAILGDNLEGASGTPSPWSTPASWTSRCRCSRLSSPRDPTGGS